MKQVHFLLFTLFFHDFVDAMRGGKELTDGFHQNSAKNYVALGIKTGKKWWIMCSGAALTPLWVITAASCFAKGADRTAMGVGYDWFWSEYLTWNGINTITVHPEFNPIKHHSNLALVGLKTGIKIDMNLTLAKVPQGNKGFNAVTWGWGLGNDFHWPLGLKYVNLSVSDATSCTEHLNPKDRSGTVYCVQTSGEGMNKGDIGAPLVTAEGDSIYAIGSWFNLDRSCRMWAYYTNLMFYKKWILKITGKVLTVGAGGKRRGKRDVFEWTENEESDTGDNESPDDDETGEGGSSKVFGRGFRVPKYRGIQFRQKKRREMANRGRLSKVRKERSRLYRGTGSKLRPRS